VVSKVVSKQKSDKKPSEGRGGEREGSGRKPKWGSGLKLKPVRFPASIAKDLEKMVHETWLDMGKESIDITSFLNQIKQDLDLARPAVSSQNKLVRMYETAVAAGYTTSHADTDVGDEIDLYQHLVKTPEKTLIATVKGDSMIDAGIYSGDLLVIESIAGTFIEPSNGDVVVAQVDDEITVKRFNRVGETVELLPENDNYEKLVITKENDFRVLGFVKHIIRSL
jgi:DNA polymerase V